MTICSLPLGWDRVPEFWGSSLELQSVERCCRDVVLSFDVVFLAEICGICGTGSPSKLHLAAKSV
jgi:hypothetical protein